MSMLRWIDVYPQDWYYRDVLEADRILLDPYSNPNLKLFSGLVYTTFEDGKPRIVKTYTATDNQVDFPLPGYVPSDDNPVVAYVDGIRAFVAGTDKDMVHLSNPVTGGLEVILMAAGVPEMKDNTYCSDGCMSSTRSYPVDGSTGMYPRFDLAHKSGYVFNMYYSPNESCVVFGKSLKRTQVTELTGDSLEDALKSAIGYAADKFAIVNGTVYVPYTYNNIPINVCYNFYDDSGKLSYVCERVVPASPNGSVEFNDRFFPDVLLSRSEFFVLLQRMRINLYNRFTDNKFVQYTNNERNIPDIAGDEWWAGQVQDIINEKFLDGCYVFPLYENNHFCPNATITRAEAVTYIDRFIEWAQERFR